MPQTVQISLKVVPALPSQPATPRSAALFRRRRPAGGAHAWLPPPSAPLSAPASPRHWLSRSSRDSRDSRGSATPLLVPRMRRAAAQATSSAPAAAGVWPRSLLALLSTMAKASEGLRSSPTLSPRAAAAPGSPAAQRQRFAAEQQQPPSPLSTTARLKGALPPGSPRTPRAAARALRQPLLPPTAEEGVGGDAEEGWVEVGSAGTRSSGGTPRSPGAASWLLTPPQQAAEAARERAELHLHPAGQYDALPASKQEWPALDAGQETGGHAPMAAAAGAGAGAHAAPGPAELPGEEEAVQLRLQPYTLHSSWITPWALAAGASVHLAGADAPLHRRQHRHR